MSQNNQTRCEERTASRIADAQAKSAMWLNRGNEARAAGNTAKAERCFEKSQDWLDKLNALEGRL